MPRFDDDECQSKQRHEEIKGKENKEKAELQAVLDKGLRTLLPTAPTTVHGIHTQCVVTTRSGCTDFSHFVQALGTLIGCNFMLGVPEPSHRFFEHRLSAAKKN